MKPQKRNEPIQLVLSVENDQPKALGSSLETEAEFSCNDQKLQVSMCSENFTDLRSRWNTIMRALIASQQSLESASRR
jgi:hypothetical protein